MGLREKLIGLEERGSRECTVTIHIRGSDERELYVENCLGVAACDSEFITLGVFGARLKICGIPLRLDNFGISGVKITGGIQTIDIEDGGE